MSIENSIVFNFHKKPDTVEQVVELVSDTQSGSTGAIAHNDGPCTACGKGPLYLYTHQCLCYLKAPCVFCVNAPLKCDDCGMEFSQ
jgi:hypothetical protein